MVQHAALPSTLRLVALLLSCCVATMQQSLEIKVTGGHTSGCGRKSKGGDTVALHYTGTVAESSSSGKPGAQFGTSHDTEPLRFELGAGKVIKGWDEGLMDMCVGETRQLTIPPEMAYGQSGSDDVPPGATVFFDVELVELERAASGARKASTKRKWLALLDSPAGGPTDPQTGLFTRSGSTSVVTCARDRWIKEAFMTAASELDDRFQFVFSTKKELCDLISLDGERIGLVNSIHQSSKEDARDITTLDLNAEASGLNLASLPRKMAIGQLREFIEGATPPAVGIMTIDSMLSTYNNARPLLALFCAFTTIADDVEPGDISKRVVRQGAFASSEQAKRCRAPLLKVRELLSAEELNSNLTMVVAEAEEHRAMELLEFGFEELESMGVGARVTFGYKYRMKQPDGNPKPEDLVVFARDLIQADKQGDGGMGVVKHHAGDGTVDRVFRPFRKSASIPRPGKKGSVKVVVGDTFDDVVLKEDRDVLVAFYAPWCEECDSMQRQLKAVAASLNKAKVKSLDIAKFDITMNDAPKNYEILGMPTLYWASRESKEDPVLYQGELSASAITAFLCHPPDRPEGRGLPAKICHTAQDEL